MTISRHLPIQNSLMWSLPGIFLTTWIATPCNGWSHALIVTVAPTLCCTPLNMWAVTCRRCRVIFKYSISIKPACSAPACCVPDLLRGWIPLPCWKVCAPTPWNIPTCSRKAWPRTLPSKYCAINRMGKILTARWPPPNCTVCRMRRWHIAPMFLSWCANTYKKRPRRLCWTWAVKRHATGIFS